MAILERDPNSVRQPLDDRIYAAFAELDELFKQVDAKLDAIQADIAALKRARANGRRVRPPAPAPAPKPDNGDAPQDGA